jgi:hypothetical protein
VVGDGACGVPDPGGEFRGRSGGFELRQQSHASGTDHLRDCSWLVVPAGSDPVGGIVENDFPGNIDLDDELSAPWPNSGGWKPLPGNGHADRVYRFVEYVNPSSPAYGYRTVFVHADTNNTDWYQWYYPNSGWTGEWTLLR